MTVDEGPAAMKTGSDGDCSDSDAAVMSTDRLSAVEQYAFTRRDLQLSAERVQMLVSLLECQLELRKLQQCEQHSAELDESAAISASAGAALSDGTDAPVPQQRDGRLLQCLYEYVVD